LIGDLLWNHHVVYFTVYGRARRREKIDGLAYKSAGQSYVSYIGTFKSGRMLHLLMMSSHEKRADL
jgi:hypothetical protein